MAKAKAPNRNQFTLLKVKMLKDGGMEVIHSVSLSEGSSTSKENRTHQSPTIPHPIFVDALAALKMFLCRSIGMFDMQTVINADTHEQEERRAAKTLAPIVEKFINHRLSLVTVNGISLSGEGNTEGVIISGTYTTPTNAKVAINSPRIQFNRDVFKFETELAELCNAVCEEAYEYIYEGKKGQATLIDEEDFEENQQQMEFEEEETDGAEEESGEEESHEEEAGETDSGENHDADDETEQPKKKKKVKAKKKPAKKEVKKRGRPKKKK